MYAQTVKKKEKEDICVPFWPFLILLGYEVLKKYFRLVLVAKANLMKVHTPVLAVLFSNFLEIPVEA